MPPRTREALITTAARLFHEQGYGSTGIATILREADVNSGSLYHFFPSKEALVVAVLEWYRKNLRRLVMDPIEAKTRDPIGRVFELLAWYRGLLAQTGCKLGCPIGNLALELADNHPEVRRLTDENFIGWTRAVKEWLEDAGGRIPSGLDRGELAQMVLNTMEGGIMQARARADLAPFDAAVRQLRLYFDYLEGDAGKSPRRPPRRKPEAPEARRTGKEHRHAIDRKGKSRARGRARRAGPRSRRGRPGRSR